MNQLPAVLLLGAKSQSQPLDAIPEELSQLNVLFEAQEKDLPNFKLDYEPYFTAEQLKTKLLKWTNQIAILHFAGHSNAKGLITDDGVVYSQHIAKILKTWNQPPALIFLNGCDNSEQVKGFHKAGVELVIATQNSVDDKKAAEFARAFYSHLFSEQGQVSIQTAFERASSQTLMEHPHEARSVDLKEFEADEQSAWDWSLFPANAASVDRNIHSLLGFRSMGISKGIKKIRSHPAIVVSLLFIAFCSGQV